MDKWVRIILEAEDMWAASAEATSLATKEIPVEVYKQKRDIFKARRIYDLYGYEYFNQFISRCPHIIDKFNDLVPCNTKDGIANCTMYCHKYDFEKGCVL